MADIGVLPADAGMIRMMTMTLCSSRGAPRGCGDDPHSLAKILSALACSPRMRG